MAKYAQSAYLAIFGNIWHISPSDPCLTDLDRILTEGRDPGAQQYLVLGTVPIKGKKRLQVKPQANKLYKEALEQCNHNNHVSKFI